MPYPKLPSLVQALSRRHPPLDRLSDELSCGPGGGRNGLVVDGAMSAFYLCATKSAANAEASLLTRNLAQLFLHCLIHGQTHHVTKWARASLRVCAALTHKCHFILTSASRFDSGEGQTWKPETSA